MSIYTIGALFQYNEQVAKVEDHVWHDAEYTIKAENWQDAITKFECEFYSHHSNVRVMHSAILAVKRDCIDEFETFEHWLNGQVRVIVKAANIVALIN